MITRRILLAAGLGATIAPTARGTAATAAVPLWPGAPPGGGGPAGAPVIGRRGALSNVVRPDLTVVAPDRPSGMAVLVAGGGGYTEIQLGTEAVPAAAWLAARGITAYVLRYRLPGEGWTAGPLAPLQDAQRALRLIRAGRVGQPAPARVAVLGFSAGGHLMGLAATRSAFASYPAVDAADAFPARPDAAALIYPVITLQPPYDRTNTRRVLVGRRPASDLSAAWSVETHVRSSCPPMFLVQAADDPISDPANAPILEAACRRAGVPVEMHRLPSGGLGFGMGDPGSPSAAWPGWYADWLRRQGLLGPS